MNTVKIRIGDREWDMAHTEITMILQIQTGGTVEFNLGEWVDELVDWEDLNTNRQCLFTKKVST